MPMLTKRRLAVALLGIPVALMGCRYSGRGAQEFSHLQPARESTIFTEKDARKVYAGMVDDCLSKPWTDNWVNQQGERPKIFVGTVQVDRRDRIDTMTITQQIEEELINSQRVRVLADREEREILRQERVDQQVFTRESDIKLVANELGADFMLIGRIGSQRYRQDNGGRVTYFQVNMELLDIETGEKVWAQTEEVRKIAAK